MGTTARKFLILSATIFLFIMGGCGDGKDTNGVVQNHGNTAVYSFAGKVATNGCRLAGVSVTLSGASGALNSADSSTTFTNISGNYTFRNLPEGNYVIRPTMNGYNFTPELYATSSLASTSISYDFTTTGE